MADPLYLTGQTGSGKSAVAMILAQRLPGAEIVNADAYQVYEGIEILSAAPSSEDRTRVPHHLFGFMSCKDECDAASFSNMARETIDQVSQRGRPIVVGGSGLYLKAITHGLADTPPGDPELRAKLDQQSLVELVSQYQQLDPEGAAATNLKNRRYVTRNLEICLLTGQAASTLKSAWREDEPAATIVYLQRSRDDIYERINRRTRSMFEAGVVEEVAALGELSSTAAKAIGINEIRALLSGECDKELCIQSIQQATRRLAKRQETWFRREQNVVRVPVAPDDSPGVTADAIFASLSLAS